MKPSLPRFIYFSEGDGQFILCTEWPYVVAQLWKFVEANTWMEKSESLRASHKFNSLVDGYKIILVVVANLEEQYGIDHSETITDMSNYFLSRINERPKRWERYLIK